MYLSAKFALSSSVPFSSKDDVIILLLVFTFPDLISIPWLRLPCNVFPEIVIAFVVPSWIKIPLKFTPSLCNVEFVMLNPSTLVAAFGVVIA